jgi:transcriptional regulator with XRE-family HTH domain
MRGSGMEKEDGDNLDPTGDRDLEAYLKQSAEKHAQRRLEMRKRRERTKDERRRNEAKTERTSAPWRHYLREWRLERGLSLTDLSLATGVTKEMISRYETYKRGLSIDVQYRLIAALGIQPSQFFHHPKSDLAELIEAAETSPEMRERMLAAIREIQRKL